MFAKKQLNMIYYSPVELMITHADELYRDFISIGFKLSFHHMGIFIQNKAVRLSDSV